MKRLVLIVVFCLLSGLVFASPVYLDCSVKSEEGKQSLFSLTVDEEIGRVTKTQTFDESTGEKRSFNFEASFTPNEISYMKSNKIGPLWVTRSLSLNRSNLSVKTISKMESTHPDVKHESETIETGFCSIVEVKDRKI